MASGVTGESRYYKMSFVSIDTRGVRRRTVRSPASRSTLNQQELAAVVEDELSNFACLVWLMVGADVLLHNH